MPASATATFSASAPTIASPRWWSRTRPHLALLISNGEFVSFHGPDPTMVRVEAAHSGAVRFVNCAFWGPCNQIAYIAGRGTVGFSDCTFVQWDHQGAGRHAIQAASGTVLVRGCDFQEDKPDIELGEAVRRAVISDNLFKGKPRIANRSKVTLKPEGGVGE